MLALEIEKWLRKWMTDPNHLSIASLSTGYHVRIEVDSYGQFEEVARTRVVSNAQDPLWDQVSLLLESIFS